MADYEVDAFRWSGKGYNAKYDTSQRVTLRDDDDTYEGGADANESVSIDGGEFVGIT